MILVRPNWGDGKAEDVVELLAVSRASGGNLERRRFVLHTEFVLGSRIIAKVIVMERRIFVMMSF